MYHYTDVIMSAIESKITSLTVVWLTVYSGADQRKRQCHFADDILECISLNENVWILINILLKFVPKGQTNNIYSIGSNNGLTRTRRKAFIWTKGG